MGIRSFLTRQKKSKSSPTSLLESPEIGSSSSSKRTQVEELEQVFRKFDANGDGKISWSELGSIMNSLGHPATEDELQKIVRVIDSDGDGFIDLNEFIELNTAGVDSTAALEDLKHAFLIFDIDGNGSISPEELQMILRRLGDEISIADCRKMIGGVDSDGNGLIDFEEFKIMMTSSFVISPTKEMADPEHNTPCRAEIFIVTHTNKKSQPSDEATELIDSMQTKLDQQARSSSQTARDDIDTKVRGPECHDPMRSLGLGPTPNYVFGTSSSQSHYSQEYVRGLENEVRELRQIIKLYDDKMATYGSLFAQLEEFLAMQKARMNFANDNAPPLHLRKEPLNAKSSPKVGLNETSLNTRTIDQRRKKNRAR